MEHTIMRDKVTKPKCTIKDSHNNLRKLLNTAGFINEYCKIGILRNGAYFQNLQPEWMLILGGAYICGVLINTCNFLGVWMLIFGECLFSRGANKCM